MQEYQIKLNQDVEGAAAQQADEIERLKVQISYLVSLLGQQDSKLKEEKSRFVESENTKN